MCVCIIYDILYILYTVIVYGICIYRDPVYNVHNIFYTYFCYFIYNNRENNNKANIR